MNSVLQMIKGERSYHATFLRGIMVFQGSSGSTCKDAIKSLSEGLEASRYLGKNLSELSGRIYVAAHPDVRLEVDAAFAELGLRAAC
jgi:hypothetical protein